jgi:hypothetical protein
MSGFSFPSTPSFEGCCRRFGLVFTGVKTASLRGSEY